MRRSFSNGANPNHAPSHSPEPVSPEQPTGKPPRPSNPEPVPVFNFVVKSGLATPRCHSYFPVPLPALSLLAGLVGGAAAGLFYAEILAQLHKR